MESLWGLQILSENCQYGRHGQQLRAAAGSRAFPSRGVNKGPNIWTHLPSRSFLDDFADHLLLSRVDASLARRGLV